MEELWKGVHQSSFQDFLAKSPIPLSLKDQDEKDKQDDEIFKQELLNSLNTPSFMSSLNSPFKALATVDVSSSPTSLLNVSCFPSSNNKRGSEDQNVNDAEFGVTRRHKRMMKNRESAARSRARRQAYTTELERELAILKEENAKLRKQQKLTPELPNSSSNKIYKHQQVTMLSPKLQSIRAPFCLRAASKIRLKKLSVSLSVTAEVSKKRTHVRSSTAPL